MESRMVVARLILPIALLALSACSEPDDHNGRWSVVSATTGSGGDNSPAAWLLDTQTGRLFHCEDYLGKLQCGEPFDPPAHPSVPQRR
jgi:hypothetical protein